MDRFSNKKILLKFLLIYLLYRILLDVMYVKLVCPIYGYSGFTISLSAYNFALSYLLIVLLVLILPKNEQKVSYMILNLHFIIIMAPMSVIYSYSNLSLKFICMAYFCFALQVIAVQRLPLIKLKGIKHAKGILIAILGGVTVVTYLYLLVTQRINLNVFDLANIYEIREQQNISNSLMGYLISWQYQLINPVIIVLAYYNKNHKMMFVFIGLQILMYFLIPHKAVLLSLGLIFLAILLQRKKIHFYSCFIGIVSTISLIGVGAIKLKESISLFSVIPVRLLYVPALIKFLHYDFFLVNKKLFYSEGMIGKLFGLTYPYNVPSGFLIGSATSNENTGYLAYAYDNAGFLGMIIMSIIFVFILILIDSLAKDHNKKIIFALLIYPMSILNDGDLLTLILTGGLFLLLIILFMLKDILRSDFIER